MKYCSELNHQHGFSLLVNIHALQLLFIFLACVMLALQILSKYITRVAEVIILLSVSHCGNIVFWTLTLFINFIKQENSKGIIFHCNGEERLVGKT